MENKITNSAMLADIKKDYIEKRKAFKRRILVCGGAGCISSHCGEVQEALKMSLAEHQLESEVEILVTGCMGTCAAGPVLLVEPDGIFYTAMNPQKVADLVERHLIGGEVCEEYTFYDAEEERYIPKLDDINFFKEQVRIALRNCGRMEFASMEAYIARDGYAAAAKALDGLSREEVVEIMKASGLRGRGGAGFPTGIKWESGLKAVSEDGQKYMVCNADEGDPGAFMDRSILEGDPHSIIEGMMLGAYAIGADKGYVYVRAEYPIAVERLSAAIEQARERGLLGTDILGSGFQFDPDRRGRVCLRRGDLPSGVHRGKTRGAEAETAVPV